MIEGKRIVVTRAKEQADGVLARLKELGAVPLEFPVIRFSDPDSYAPMDEAISNLPQYDWAIFTSVNGVDFFWRRLEKHGKGAESFSGIKLGAIGPATADALRARGLALEFVPSKFVAEGILEDINAKYAIKGKKFLLPRAAIARENLVEGLEQLGADVTQVSAYNTEVGGSGAPGELTPEKLVQMLETGEVDIVTFTSSSTVRNFATRLAAVSTKPLPELLSNTTVACIGPITAGTAREFGLTVNLSAPEYTIDGLIAVIQDHFGVLTV
jgi:uroporphyrinogen III methyltransferase / synthase